MINGGQDLKFNSAPELVSLNGWLDDEEYRSAISAINEKIKRARATAFDAILVKP
jgi:hypothetical protein